jgi:choline-sulfatase
MAFFEPSARVPLIVRTPGLEPRLVADPVSQLDVGGTLLRLCGLSDGPSMLDGPPGDVVAEYLAEGVNSPAVMLRRGRWKYIRCEDDPDQLYDLSSDPHELTNLAGSSPEHASELRAEVDARWDLPALKATVLRSQEQRRLVVAALRSGRPTSWNYIPRSDGEYVGGKDDLYELQRRARLDAS